jgi:hypothetical protein
MARTPHTARRKERITVSLEHRTVEFLNAYAKAKASSVSACVEQIVAAARRNSELEQVNAQTRAYYDSLSEPERQAEAAWGKFAEGELTEAER